MTPNGSEKPRFEKSEIEERLSFLRGLGVLEATP